MGGGRNVWEWLVEFFCCCIGGKDDVGDAGGGGGPGDIMVLEV
jgi:hypothetical protein